MSDFDHGELQIPLARRQRGAAAESRRYTEQQRRERAARSKAIAAEARKVEAERVRLTREDVEGAQIVRTDFGWRKVVRVNTKTVTVHDSFFGNLTVAFDRIHEVRR